MKTKFSIAILIYLAIYSTSNAQSGTTPPDAAMSVKMNSTAVNFFSGLPSVGVPLYSYKSPTGIGVDINLSYSGGGIKLSESATSVGLGWQLSVGGSINRIVKGIPDDYTNGFMNTAAIPNDFRAKANDYDKQVLDAEQDIYQFSFQGHSGKFFIGKNKEIVIVPKSKIKIQPQYNIYNGIYGIYSFNIIDELGNKFIFETTSNSTSQISNNFNPPIHTQNSFSTSWMLNQIVSNHNLDTIEFNYTTKSVSYNFRATQFALMNDATNARQIF